MFENIKCSIIGCQTSCLQFKYYVSKLEGAYAYSTDASGGHADKIIGQDIQLERGALDSCIFHLNPEM